MATAAASSLPAELLAIVKALARAQADEDDAIRTQSGGNFPVNVGSGQLEAHHRAS
jgi:hypothetical protein